MPGQIVNSMRLLADHPFMRQSTAISKNRYGLFPDIARILLYTKHGVRDSGSNSLYTFFEQERNMNKDTAEYKRIVIVLNHLERCFPTTPGNYQHLEKHTWVLAVFTMIDELVYKKNYTLAGQYEHIGKFIKKFHSDVYNEDFRKSHTNHQRFYDYVRGGWSEKLIALRRDILIEELLAKHQLRQLDVRRQVSDAEKIALFSKQPTCTQCSTTFKDYKEAEYHHIVRHADGGETNMENTMILCKNCHRGYS
jgi:5-methylcytosine-specific restriction endonuclease McrA